MSPHRPQVAEQGGLDRARVDAGAGRRPGQAGCVGGLAAHDSLRRCQGAGLAGQCQAHQEREDGSERGHERRRDGVGSLPICGRDQGPHRQPGADRGQQREHQPADDQHRRRQRRQPGHGPILEASCIPRAAAGLTDSQIMRALPVQPEPLWRIDFRQRIAVSLWFLPTIFAAAAIVAANLTIWLDARVDAPVGVRPDLVSDPGSAATFAAAIAAATLAFVAVVFATTLVAIQLAASQYSPRTVRIFIRSRITRVTLGLFLATFVFSVIILVSNRAPVTSARQFAPVVSVTTLLALTVATVFGFVAYLHGVVRLMRVQYLLETIAAETRQAIEENFPPASAYLDAQPPPPDPSPRRLCYTGTAGVVTATDLHGLVELCRQKQCWLELTAGVGEYLAHGTPVALVHGGDLRERDVTRFFLIRGERTFVQDPAFGFRQLVDVAIRALSPAVNDPTTGVQASRPARRIAQRSACTHEPGPVAGSPDLVPTR